jgi:outer membrane protein assembly factor BamC
MKPVFWLKCTFSASLISLLGACGMLKSEDGMFRDRDKDYLRTNVTEEMKVPGDMESRPISPLYPVPEVHAVDEFGDPVDMRDYEVPRPDAVNADEQFAGVKLQKLGGRRWISLAASTSQVWPRTQSFLTSADLGVVAADARQGVIETDWVQFKDEVDKKMRFRILLEKGVQPETTEIHIRNVEYDLDEEVAQPFSWPELSMNDTREEWMVRELANHLAASINNASASLLGQNVGGPLKANFLQAAAEPTLRLSLPEDRAWATIVHSAKQETFRVWGSDRNQGVIYLRYSDDFVKKCGFFCRLSFKSGRDKVDEKPRYEMEKILQHLSGSSHVRALFDGREGVAYGSSLKKAEGYLLVVSFEGDYTDVVLRDHRGRVLPVREGKRLIKILRKNLI